MSIIKIRMITVIMNAMGWLSIMMMIMKIIMQ